MQFWQLGTMNIYFIWLNLKTLSENSRNYVKVSKLSKYEDLRDFVLPANLNLIILLFITNFIFTIYDDSKAGFVFKTSRGTNSEQISQWLSRYYQTFSLNNLSKTVQDTLFLGDLLMLISVVFTLVISITYWKLISQIMKSRRSINIPSIKNVDTWTWVFLMTIVTLPITFIYIIVPFHLDNILAVFNDSFILGIITASLAMCVSIIFTTMLRIAFYKFLDTFRLKSLIFISSLLFLQLFPPLTVFISSFQLQKWIVLDGDLIIKTSWIVSHCSRIIPILSVLLIVTHFRIKNDELTYLLLHKSSIYEILKVSFLKRFGGDYFLIFLITFSMILNEDIINSVLSDVIPSFTNELKMSSSGKSSDYAKAMGYFSVSLFVSLFAVGIWNSVVINNLRMEKKDGE
jgi:hypothetical protein